MAKLIINDEEYDVKDGDGIASACKDAGLLFNCRTGVCGSCLVRVQDGQSNLSPLSQEELDLGLDESSRLACVCQIKTGIVRILFS